MFFLPMGKLRPRMVWPSGQITSGPETMRQPKGDLLGSFESRLARGLLTAVCPESQVAVCVCALDC